jgi:16S rRNA (cytosine967-C5)-methyltransferase
MKQFLGAGGSAREAALEALRRVEEGHGFLRNELHDLFGQLALPPRDRALAHQLAAGTVRHRRTLRLVLSHVRGPVRPPVLGGGHGREGSIQPPLRRILELGAFQLLFLDRVPAYAVVNEAVEEVRRTARGPRGDKAAGFINAMLRGVGRLVAGRDPEGRPQRDALPHPEGGVVRLTASVLPDPAESFAAFLGAAYSFPDWLVARWLSAFGDRAEEICRWSNRRPRTFARINPMRGDPWVAPGLAPSDLAPRDLAPGDLPPGDLAPREYTGGGAPEDVSSALRPPASSPGAEGAHGPRPGSVDVSALPPEQLEPLLAEGVLTVQDPSAMLAAEALAPAPGEAVLDLCASPGTKTTQIVERMGDRGRVVACDRTQEKLEPLRQAVAARGLASVTVCLSDAAAAAAPPGGFDAALVDAPCSNTGVLARRVEVRWRLRPEDLAELPRIQGELLMRAAGLVRPGGRLVYSTCSLQPEENGEVVARFLKENPGWRLVRSDLVLPGADCDGAFWALLAR